MIALAPAEKRQCGTCTACCDGWVEGTIYGHEMKPGVPCHFRGEGCCTIYERRPEEPCRRFVCGNRPAYIIKSAGRDPDEALLTWMRGLSVQTGAPFFYEQTGERFGFGPPEFQHEMLVKLETGERLCDGSQRQTQGGHGVALPQQEGPRLRARHPGPVQP
ncbi:MAG TPA: hypothetical protein VE085_12085 [Burkholderiales bacterium]|nr:hypothetical protein [Burkholderiales bacterium]